jgi:hypothetical protein
MQSPFRSITPCSKPMRFDHAMPESYAIQIGKLRIKRNLDITSVGQTNVELRTYDLSHVCDEFPKSFGPPFCFSESRLSDRAPSSRVLTKSSSDVRVCMSRIKRSHVSSPNPDQPVVRAYVNQMIKYQGCDEGLSPNGRKYAFIQVWAVIPHYRWNDGDDRDPINRLADLIQNPEKRRNDLGLIWLDLSVQSAVDDALARDFDRTRGRKMKPFFDSEIVNTLEPLVDDPTEAMEEAELQKAFKDAIGDLSELEQRVLALSLAGRDIEEIQGVLGCCRTVAYQRIRKIVGVLAYVLVRYK